MTDILPTMLAADGRLSSIAGLSQRCQAIELPPFLVYLIDSVQTEWLPLLAEQLHVSGDEGWLLAQTDAQRRQLIRRAIALHRSKGTRWALVQVLATLGLNGRISEWFEYQGEPYHFRIELDLAGGALTESTYHAFRQMLEQYRNARSTLEGLTLRYERQDRLPWLAATAEGGELATVYPYRIGEIRQQNTLCLAASQGGSERATIYPYRQTRWLGAGPLNWAGGQLVRETVTLPPRGASAFPKAV
ncbi:phage tail protein I [Chromobacterium sp. IIBBL 290-4]|uniref:phage tail protein I n=1 Tax=Chromobacterium sp. IIBBL 290-4 TaxID=2953890 RepID=UPI0020B64B63|nr:phage tail protein I [Chromobacterium sp. IIBBL 290-4]UTH76095.1 phage tail protein I [Chromobacterium sp. IIBBL 290-4]